MTAAARRIKALMLVMVAVGMATAACGKADATQAVAAPRPPEAFPPKGESLAGLKQWLARNSTLKPETYVSVGDRYAVALTSSDYGGTWIRAVQVQIEVVSEDFAARLGGRSAVLAADIDCSARRAMPRIMTVHPRSNLQGEGERLTFPARWITAGQGAYLDDVIGASCDAKFRRPFDTTTQLAGAEPHIDASTGHLVPSSVLGAYVAPPPAATTPAPAPAPAAVAAAPPAPAPPRPAPPAPVSVAQAAPPRPAVPAPAPAMRPTPPITAPAAVAAATPSKRPAPPAPAPAPVKAAAAPAAGGFAVQVAAVPTMALADQAWSDLSSSPPIRGRPRRIQTIAADGKTFYRVLVAGFADRGAAQTFCASLKSAGRDCLVRSE